MSARHGVDKRIDFLGKRTDVVDLLSAADFGILTSRSESGPVALLEYGAAALPFVATRVGSIGRDLAERGLPEFVPPADEHALAQALERLLALPPQQLRARGENGRLTIRPHYDIEAVMPLWYEVYEHALGQAQ